MARKKRALGGKATLYNAKGSPAAASAEKDSDDGFKRGGKACRAEGGAVTGVVSTPSLAKRARGGSIPARKHGGSVRGMQSRGGSPMSSGHAISSPSAGKNAGHEGESVAAD